ncbi:MAG TPA: alpha-L-arabinofuranosidase C-terminal domain-containing protein [Candidatus Limnocylindrales bacterium]
MGRTTVVVDREQAIGRIDRRLFGSFVEHLGRCVYGGIYAPGSPLSDEHGFRQDVATLIRDLGVTVVRYPGGNFVSGYRWVDGVGPRDARPSRLNLAWHQTDPNSFGLHEFVDWSRKLGVEPMLAVNLGTSGIAEALDLLEYSNHPGGTTLSDRRLANGAARPFGVRMWCLGNEPDGPWQLGHKTALEYGRLAAETARGMRQFDEKLELVVAGSTAPWLPSSVDWDRIVLEETVEFADYVAVHIYVEEVDRDIQTFLASGVELDREIERAIAAADGAAKKRGVDRKLAVSVDEWGVWRDRDPNPPTFEGWPLERRIGESVYTAGDAVVTGALIVSLLNHADRVTCACQSLLVNAGAPIRAEADGVWRQSIYHPFQLAARHASGTALRATIAAPEIDTSKYGRVAEIDVAATLDEEQGQLVLFLVNRNASEAAVTSVRLGSWPDARLAEALVIGGGDPWETSTREHPEGVVPRKLDEAVLDGDSLEVALPPASWSVVRLATASKGGPP